MKKTTKLLKIFSYFPILSITGCTSLSNVLTNNSEPYFILSLSNNKIDRTNPEIIIKNTPELRPFCISKEKYFNWATTCYFGKNAPTSLTIEYTQSNLNSVEYFKDTPKALKEIQTYAQSLPASAWKTYTIYPQQIVEKAKTMPVLVNGELKPYDPAKYSKGTNLKLILYIDNQGKVTEEIKHEIIYRNNPAA